MSNPITTRNVPVELSLALARIAGSTGSAACLAACNALVKSASNPHMGVYRDLAEHWAPIDGRRELYYIVPLSLDETTRGNIIEAAKQVVAREAVFMGPAALIDRNEREPHYVAWRDAALIRDWMRSDYDITGNLDIPSFNMW